MLTRIGDSEFFVQSIEELNETADRVAWEITAFEQHTATLAGSGDGRLTALLTELRAVENTLRAKATGLESILTCPAATASAKFSRAGDAADGGILFR